MFLLGVYFFLRKYFCTSRLFSDFFLDHVVNYTMARHPVVQLVHTNPCPDNKYYNTTSNTCEACPSGTVTLKMSNNVQFVHAACDNEGCIPYFFGAISSVVVPDYSEENPTLEIHDLWTPDSTTEDYQTLGECTCKDNYFVGSSSKDMYRGTYNNRGNQYDYCADWDENNKPWCRTYSQGDCGDDGDGKTWRRCGAETKIQEQKVQWNCSQINQYNDCVDCCQKDTGAGSRHNFGNNYIGIYHKEWDTCVKNACLS